MTFQHQYDYEKEYDIKYVLKEHYGFLLQPMCKHLNPNVYGMYLYGSACLQEKPA